MRRLQIIAAALWMVAVACSGDGGETAGAAPVGGRVETTGLELFEERVIGANPGCITCHSLEAGISLVGPSLSGVSSRLADLDTAEYIRQSILDPDAFVVEGFLAGQMSPNWGEYLTPDQVDSLIELLTNLP